MSRVSKTITVTSVAVALLVAGCDDPQLTSGPEPTDAPSQWDTQVTWEPCPEVARQALSTALPGGLLPGVVTDVLANVAVALLSVDRTYECATLTVPQDWENPDSGETFDLALLRVSRKDSDNRIGSLVINPGGPGGSGIDTAVQLSVPPQLLGFGLPEEVQSRFDIVGFDPRGVSRSSPVECYSDQDLDEMFGADPDPQSQAEFDEAVAAAAGRGEACEAKYGDALGLYTTRQTVHDMDAIRAAVGDEQLTYLGYSYGTLLGGIYAHLYPDNVRAMVLDGVVDPQPAEGDGGGGQLAGFERAFGNFTAWCDSTPNECPLAPDSYNAVFNAIEQSRQSPVPGDGRDATPGWIWHAVIATLYSEARWPELGVAISDLEQGNPNGVFTLADSYAGRQPDGTYPQNLFEVLTTVNCNDSEFRGDVDGIRSAQEQLRDEYPMFGAGFAVGGLECSQWPTEPDPFPYGAAEGAPPIVLVGTTGDPATPYENTQSVADLLGTGVVLTHEGEGHTIYGQQQECVNQAVNAYLVDLTVPPDGTTC